MARTTAAAATETAAETEAGTVTGAAGTATGTAAELVYTNPKRVKIEISENNVEAAVNKSEILDEAAALARTEAAELEESKCLLSSSLSEVLSSVPIPNKRKYSSFISNEKEPNEFKYNQIHFLINLPEIGLQFLGKS